MIALETVKLVTDATPVIVVFPLTTKAVVPPPTITLLNVETPVALTPVAVMLVELRVVALRMPTKSIRLLVIETPVPILIVFVFPFNVMLEVPSVTIPVILTSPFTIRSVPAAPIITPPLSKVEIPAENTLPTRLP